MVIGLVKTVVLWLNNFPPNSGVSESYSPLLLLSGTRLDMKKHCRIEIGAYAQIYNEPAPTNTMTPRTDGAICLGPVGNPQGSVRFLNLTTGKEVVRRQFTVLPITREVKPVKMSWDTTMTFLPF